MNIITQPNNLISAFNDAIYVLETNTTDAILCEIKSGSTVLGQQYAVRIGGYFTFNLKGLLSTILTNFNNPLLTGTPLNTLTTSPKNYSAFPLEIRFSEVLPPPVFVISNTHVIHRSSLNGRNDLWTSNMMLAKIGDEPRYAYKSDIIPLTFIGANSALTFNLNGASWGITLTNYMNNYTYKTNGDNFYVIVNGKRTDWYLKEKPKRGKTIYWINQFGGWESFIYVDYDERQLIEKQNYYTYLNPNSTNRTYNTSIDYSQKELKLYSYPVDGSKFEYLKSIIYSPIILDENGERVELVTESLVTNLNDIHTPDITIRYLNQNIMNF